MSSSDFWFSIKDGFYWLFENTLETLGDLPWIGVMLFGFAGFAYWMKRQVDYNKAAENDPNQIK